MSHMLEFRPGHISTSVSLNTFISPLNDVIVHRGEKVPNVITINALSYTTWSCFYCFFFGDYNIISFPIEPLSF